MRHYFFIVSLLFVAGSAFALANPYQGTFVQNVQLANQGSRLDSLITARDKMMQDARTMDVQLNELKPVTEGRGSPDEVSAARLQYDTVKKTQDANQKKLNQIMSMIAEERKKLFNER